MRGKSLLQISGPADPTGCGKGFSYIRVSNKPPVKDDDIINQEKRLVNGTDSDLRRLRLKEAISLLREFQVPKEEISKLSRWEVIDLLRTLSTEKTKKGDEELGKFSRGSKFSFAAYHERYKEDCQRIFDLQNFELSSSKIIQTDQEGSSSSSEESVIDELGWDYFYSQSCMETNDCERKRVLKITRTFKDADGNEHETTEFVRNAGVIKAYCKIRNIVQDEDRIKNLKREKRRIQEKLRRIKRNQCKEQNEKPLPLVVKTKCGACFQVS